MEPKTTRLTLPRAVLLIAFVAGLIYGLDRGIFVGSEIRKDRPQSTTHYRYCKYLTITGVVEARADWWGESMEEARSRTSCTILRSAS